MGNYQMRLGPWIRPFAVSACIVLLAFPAVADWKQAVAYYQRGEYEKSLQELKPDLDKNPDWEPGHRLAGLNYLYLKNDALAIAELSRAVQLKSKEFITFYGLAQAYFNARKYDNCVQALNQGEQYAKQGTDLYNLYHLRGAANYRQDQYDKTIEDLTSAIRIKPNDWADVSQLGIAYYNLRRYEEATQTLQKALTLKPGDAAVTGVLGKIFFNRGVAALSSKQYPQAIDLFRQAATYTPNDGYVHYNTAEAFLFMNNHPEAEKAYTQALAFLPRNADIYQRLGFLYEKQKKWDQALKAYQKAQDLEPSAALKESIARVAEMKKK